LSITAGKLAARIFKSATPVVILAGFWVNSRAYADNWSGFKYLALSFALSLSVAAIGRRPFREIAIVAASALFGLSAVEAFAIIREDRPIDRLAAGYSVSQPILGWGPEHPGVFHQTKLEAKTRRVIFDVDYTIDGHRTRKVVSAESGPAVAFFGDSMTFGTGLSDGETLPQLFADDYERKIRVLNLGFPGYGPQQFLRALETGIYDDMLRGNLRLVVYETAPWHAERSSCTSGFMLRAPRYEMVDGRATYEGACYDRWATALGQLFANTSLYRVFFEPLQRLGRDDIDLYVAILARASQIAREKYGAATLILYLPAGEGYLKGSGFTDDMIMQCMRDAGLDVVNADLDSARFPGQPLTIPGDGHPTAIANAARAEMVKAYIERINPPLLVPLPG